MHEKVMEKLRPEVKNIWDHAIKMALNQANIAVMMEVGSGLDPSSQKAQDIAEGIVKRMDDSVGQTVKLMDLVEELVKSEFNPDDDLELYKHVQTMFSEGGRR